MKKVSTVLYCSWVKSVIRMINDVCVSTSESVELFIEDQAFSPPYDLPPPPPIKPPRQSRHRKIEKERQIADGWRAMSYIYIL